MRFKLGGREQQIRSWQLMALAILIGLAGAGSAWQQDKQATKVGTLNSFTRVHSSGVHQFPLVPNAFHSFAAFPVSSQGPLEPPNQRAIRLAEEARQATRELVKPDRSNVDCSLMKCLAITFDDGPSTEFTPQLLDILKQRRAVATFFVVGSLAASRIDILKQEAQAGNEIGNHTWSHVNLTRLKDPDIANEINRTNDIITVASGQAATFMRPPMGAYNPRVATQVHMPLALWSVDPRDWRDRNPELIYQRVLDGAGQGKVILLHDIYATTLQTVPPIIDELQRQGYVLVTMSELVGITPVSAPNLAGQVFRSR